METIVSWFAATIYIRKGFDFYCIDDTDFGMSGRSGYGQLVTGGHSTGNSHLYNR